MSVNPLSGIGELSKPATVLIEKISDAIGGIFKPHQIKRIAKAEVEAEIIKVKGEFEVKEIITHRAMHRFVEEETKKQQNIEEITRKALPRLNDDAKSEEIENDWIVNFFDKCRLISDTEMQELWSQVLSGEANKPNSFSKRTVNFLPSLDKGDAISFTSLCKFVWRIGDLVTLIFNVDDNIYNRNEINFNSLMHLENIGLVTFNHLTPYIGTKLPKKITVFYYGRQVNLTLKENIDNHLEKGMVILSKIGQELAPICKSQPDNDFFKYVCNKCEKEGILIKEPPEQNKNE